MDIYDRIPYSAIVDRKPLTLPDGGRVIVWPVVTPLRDSTSPSLTTTNVDLISIARLLQNSLE